MIGPENMRARVRVLMENGSLPLSACGREFMSFIQPLVASDIVATERAGAGRRLKVQNAEALAAWYRDHFPVEAMPDAPARVAALAQFRDTKALASNTATAVQVRCWNDSALLCAGQPVSAALATRTYGVFSFLLEDAAPYRLCAPCAAIENPALFHSFEKLRLDAEIPVALYAGGRMSRRLFSWLVSQDAPAFRLTHFPDYDPVGLSEYVRLRRALGSRVKLFVPPNLPQAFQTFGNRKLLRNASAQSLLAGLRSSTLPEVRSIVRLIDDHNCGLEQEALLLGS